MGGPARELADKGAGGRLSALCAACSAAYVLVYSPASTTAAIVGSTGVNDKVRENRLRRQAYRLGLMLRKSRARRIHLDDLGGYMLIDTQYNAIVGGDKFNLDLDGVEEMLDEREGSLGTA